MPTPKMPSASPALRRREPAVDQRHADSERRAAEPEEEPAEQHHRVGVVADVTDEEHRQDRQRADQREHDARAEPVGERADRDASQRAHDDGDGHQQRRLDGAQIQPAREEGAQRADQRPGPEVHGESDGRHGQHRPGLAGDCGSLRPPGRHRLSRGLTTWSYSLLLGAPAVVSWMPGARTSSVTVFLRTVTGAVRGRTSPLAGTEGPCLRRPVSSGRSHAFPAARGSRLPSCASRLR